MSPKQLRAIVRQRFGSQAALARHLNVGQPYISEIVNGIREVPPRVAEALGLKR